MAKTQDQIIREALELAGNIGLTTRAQGWIEDVLEDLYAQRDWPFLKRAFQLVLSQGVVNYNLQDVGKPLYQRRLYNILRAELFFNGQFVRELDIVGADESPAFRDPNAQTTVSQGNPIQCYMDMTGKDAAVLSVYPPPNGVYTINLVCHSVLLTEVTYNGGNKVLYPNDRTVMQGLIAEIMMHRNDEREFTERELFEKMVTKDVSKYGQGSGINMKWGLQKRVYGQPGVRNASPWGWMGPQ
jgi:hypothetical protein